MKEMVYIDWEPELIGGVDDFLQGSKGAALESIFGLSAACQYVSIFRIFRYFPTSGKRLSP